MKLVGATRQALGEFYSQAINFPAAVDRLYGAALATPENTEALTETIPDFDRLPKSERSTASKGERLLRGTPKHQQPYTESFTRGHRPSSGWPKPAIT